MKAVVLAYHNIGCVGIRSLLAAGVEIEAVFTHGDNPRENIWFESVAELCAQQGLKAYAPDDINQPPWVELIRQMEPDFLFSFYYRQLIRQPLLDIPKRGCVNLHGSLLPKYRGRVPVNWAVIHGETETGVTLHYMTRSPDAGDVIAQRAFPIGLDDTALDIHHKAAAEAGILLDETLPKLMAGTAARIPQKPSEATYFHGRTPADGLIHWDNTSREIRNLIRGVTRPYPGAFTFSRGKKIIIWKATDMAGTTHHAPGTVLSVEPFVIACGQGALQIDAGQDEKGLSMAGQALAENLQISAGMVLGSR